jgi:hypothetical protein
MSWRSCAKRSTRTATSSAVKRPAWTNAPFCLAKRGVFISGRFCEAKPFPEANGSPARAKNLSPRQKRRGSLFSRCGLPPFEPGDSLTTASLCGDKAGGTGKVSPGPFWLRACFFARATRPAVLTNSEIGGSFYFVLSAPGACANIKKFRVPGCGFKKG